MVFFRQLTDVESICDMIARHVTDPCFCGEQTDNKGKGLILPTHIPTHIGRQPPYSSFWKLNVHAAWSANTNSGGWGWVLRNHLDHVRLVGLKFVPRCQKVKLLKVMAICFGLKTLSSISISNTLEGSDCLESSFY